MRSKCSSRVHLILASLLLLWGGSFRASHAVAPTVTISGLEVNGVFQACGSTKIVTGGSTVCVLFSTNQNGFAQAFLSQGTSNARFCSGNVFPRTSPWRCCFTFSSTPISGTRTITVTVTNSANETGSATCTLTVGSGSQTQLSGSVRTQNGCGVTFFNGNTVQVIVNSNMTATARVTLTYPDGSTVILFNSTVGPGDTTVASGTAGGASGTRTLNLRLTVGSTVFNAPPCTYSVTANTLAPTTP